MAGNDELDGGDDIDHAVFQSELLDYFILNNVDQIEVTGPASDGNDELIDIERLHFTDISLAFDLDGNAGDIAKLLGVLLGFVPFERLGRLPRKALAFVVSVTLTFAMYKQLEHATVSELWQRDVYLVVQEAIEDQKGERFLKHVCYSLLGNAFPDI